MTETTSVYWQFVVCSKVSDVRLEKNSLAFGFELKSPMKFEVAFLMQFESPWLSNREPFNGSFSLEKRQKSQEAVLGE